MEVSAPAIAGRQRLTLEADAGKLLHDQRGVLAVHVHEHVALMNVDRADDGSGQPRDTGDLANDVRRRDEMFAADI